MELLADHIGEDFGGTVTGVTGAGVYIQIDKYLIDGFVRSNDLPGAANDRWKHNPKTGALVAQRSGHSVSIGNTFTVRVASVDLGRRVMELVVVDDRAGGKRKAKPAGNTKPAPNKTKLKNKKKVKKRNSRASRRR